MNDPWARLALSMRCMSPKQLHKVIRLTRRELAARHQAADALKERLSGGFSAMAKFMAGVTWALACRAALRESKGHDPSFGKRPAAGDMWLPRELLTAVRHQVKARGWHPITAPDWSNVQHNLMAEQARKGRPPEEAFAAVQFVVPLAPPTYSGVICPRDIPDGRFDHGGEA